MPLPLIPIISALIAGGTLVPHAAGGMIVTSAGGYMAGTYLSTAAIGGLIAAASTTLGAGALYFSGVAGSVIGSAGIFGTTVGASGITGALMTAGIISSTPIWVPLAIGGVALTAGGASGYGAYQLYKLRKKLKKTPAGEEAQFTEIDAKIIENLIKRIGKKDDPDIKQIGQLFIQAESASQVGLIQTLAYEKKEHGSIFRPKR